MMQRNSVSLAIAREPGETLLPQSSLQKKEKRDEII